MLADQDDDASARGHVGQHEQSKATTGTKLKKETNTNTGLPPAPKGPSMKQFDAIKAELDELRARLESRKSFEDAMATIMGILVDAPFDLIDSVCTRVEYPRGQNVLEHPPHNSRGRKAGKDTLEQLTKIRVFITQLREFRRIKVTGAV